MFTIFGASGNTGSIVAARLLAAGKQVRVVARTADKVAKLAQQGAEVVVGDVRDAKLVARALAGAEGAYLLLPPDLAATDMLATNRGIVDNYVAGLGGVAHAVFLSSVGAQYETGTGPILGARYGELALAKTATKLTFLRASYFMENLLMNAHPMKADGVLPVFGGGESHPFPMNATRDIGELAADALLAPPASTEWLELRGPRDYSYVDAAAIASQILGRPVKATPVPIDAMVPTLIKVGLSANVAGLFREMTEAFARGLAFEGKGRAVRGKVELAEVLRAAL